MAIIASSASHHNDAMWELCGGLLPSNEYQQTNKPGIGIMRRFFIVLAAALTVPLSASAGSSLSIDQMNCSGDLVTSVLDDVLISCSGSFSISGGSIISSSGVEITANGNLSLDNLTISAFLIWLSTSGTISIGDSMGIFAGNSWENLAMPVPSRDATILVSGYSGTRPVLAGSVSQSDYPGSLLLLPGGDISLVAAVPEPEVVGLLLLGLPVVLSVARRRGRRSFQTAA